MKIFNLKHTIIYYKFETAIVLIIALIINNSIVGTFSYYKDQPLIGLETAGISLEDKMTIKNLSIVKIKHIVHEK